MKITKRNLRKIIRKEKRNLLERGSMTAQGPEPGVDYIMYPDEYTRAAEQLLTPEEFQSVETRHAILAIDLADELAWRYEDSMEGFGSSDRTYEIQGYLNQLGFKTGFPNGSLEVIREGKMKISKRQLRRIIKEEKAKLFKEDAGIADYYKSKQKAVSEVQEEIEAAYRVLKTLDRSSGEYSDQKMVIAALEDKRLHVGYTGD